MTVAFRPAAEADYPAICALVPTEDELFLVYPRGRHPFSVDQVAALAKSRHALTVAVDGDDVIGFANLYDLIPATSVFIGNVVIAPPRRREGLGRRLTQYMLDLAFNVYPVPEARLSVFSHNAPALRLYAGLGFEPYGLEWRQHPRGEDWLLLHMRLPRPAIQANDGSPQS